MNGKLVVIPVNELKMHLLEVLTEIENRKENLHKEQAQRETLYTINEVAKRLSRAHSTIKKLVGQGILRTTPDGRISEKTINDYLVNA